MSELLELSEEQRFRLLVGAVTDYAIYMLDAKGHIATWNPGAERFKGYKAEEVIGQHYSRFFTPEDAAADLPARALRIASREGRFESEGWRVRKDGSRFWANVVLDPIRGDDGRLIGFAKVTRDITAKREREQELFQSEQRFRMLVQGVRDYAIYMLDPEGRITNWNSGAQAIKGYAESEVVGRHFSMFYTDEDRDAGEPAHALEVALEEGRYEREAWRVRKDGSLFWANVVIDPVRGEDGEHIGFAKITRDVTARKRAEDELDAAREALAQSQKMQALGELTGGIAHDFNNLMTVIAGASDFLLKHPDVPAEKRGKYLQAIVETTERATSLTNHLLSFGRRQSLHPEVIDVNVRLDAFGEVVARMLGSRIRLKLRHDAADARVEVDAAQFETALLNAVFNARDAMPEGGELTIATEDAMLGDAPAVRITVRDSGQGIAPDHIERVFEPFFTTKEVGKGTGLGLSQIHGFAAQAGGEVKVVSEVGNGTALRLVLPRVTAPVSAKREAGPVAAVPAGLKVLLVEDNAQVCAFAATLLGDLGCDVIAAGNGAEALERLGEGSFDLVFSDIVMPGMSGIELAGQVRRKLPDLPVLLATGYTEELVGKHEKPFPILRKPYNSTTLGSAIAATLRDARGALWSSAK